MVLQFLVFQRKMWSLFSKSEKSKQKMRFFGTSRAPVAWCQIFRFNTGNWKFFNAKEACCFDVVNSTA
jgi:hypothetical protein